MTSPYSYAGGIPAGDPTPVTTFGPLELPVAGRPVPMQLKVSAPAVGDDLPIVLFSHGHGPANFESSLHGYGPLVEFWAAHGFAVIQPTHLDSATLGLRDADDPDAPLYVRSRAEDMHHVLDRLDEIETGVPGLAGRLDRTRIAAAGHSLGGHTTGVLCGQTVTAWDDDLSDARVTAGVLIAPPGDGEGLNGEFASTYSVLGHTHFDAMTTPTLVVAGDEDQNPMFSDHPDWRTDAHRLAPAPKTLLTLFGAGHSVGGIATYDGAWTTDENPQRVAVLRALIGAWLRSTLYPSDPAWADAVAALPTQIGATESE